MLERGHSRTAGIVRAEDTALYYIAIGTPGLGRGSVDDDDVRVVGDRKLTKSTAALLNHRI